MYQSNRGFNITLPPRAYPGHLTPFPAREGGHLITTHRGLGNLIANIDVMLRVTLIPRGLITPGGDGGRTNFDEFKRKDCVFVADWVKTKGLRKLCSVFEGV